MSTGANSIDAGDLLELAAILCNQGPLRLDDPRPFSVDGLRLYQEGSLARIDNWLDLFNSLCDDEKRYRRGWSTEKWITVRTAFEEIATGETLARTFAAFAHLFDRSHPQATKKTTPIAEAILGQHLRPRNRMLRHLVENREIPPDESKRLLDLCRRAEKWTDMLIGYMDPGGELHRFGTKADRIKDYSADFASNRSSPSASSETPHQKWPLLEISLRAAFQDDLRSSPLYGQLNRQIAAGVLECLVVEPHLSSGPIHSLWENRIWAMADTTQSLLDAYFLDTEDNHFRTT
jgi:hypothetical protein